jgi:predicted MFS family arabinose efflux permease
VKPIPAFPQAPIPMPSRFRVLILYACLQAAMQWEWLRLAPVTDDAAALYGVSVGAIGMFSLVFPVLFVLLALPSGALIDRWPVRTSLRLASLVMVIAVLGRAQASSYAEALGFQTLLALVQPLVMGLAGRLAATWFDDRQRLLATEISSMALFVGLGLAFVLVPLAGGGMLRASLWADVVVLALLALLVFVAVPPDPPPSVATSVPVVKSLWRGQVLPLLKTPPLLAVLGLILLGNGYFNAVSTWIEPILQRHRVDALHAGLVALCMLVGAIVGMFWIEPLRRRIGLRLLLVLASLGSIAITLLLFTSGDFVLLCIAGLLLGAALLAPLPLLVATVVDAAGPARAGMALSLFWLAGNIGASAAVFALSWAADHARWDLGAGFLLAVLLVQAAIAGCGLRGVLPSRYSASGQS